MTSNGKTMDGLDVNEICGERIKVGLIETIKKHLKSDNIQLCVEHGSKKGEYIFFWKFFMFGSNFCFSKSKK